VISQLIVREWANCVITALTLCLCWRFFWVMVETDRSLPKHRAAIALCVIFLGETLRSSWAWLALAAQNKHWAIFPVVQNSYELVIAATSIMLVGTLCCLRVFASPAGAHGGWVSAVVMVAAFLMLTIML
jgi:hypothetical protein